MSTTTAVLGKFLKKQTAVILPQVCHLHLQEYQSKELLRTNGCIVQKFFLVDRKNNEHHLLDELFNRHAYSEYVVKSQILAGGRGKGRFIGDEKGGKGVFITRSPQEAKDSVRNMIGKRLVTTQTSPKGNGRRIGANQKGNISLYSYGFNHQWTTGCCLPKWWSRY